MSQTITATEFLEIARRLEHNRRHGWAAKPQAEPAGEPEDAADRETGHGGLHEEISKHCARQWPPWLLVHSRSDKRSTLPLGCNDDIIFLPGGRFLLLEEKAKDGKLSDEQQIWNKQMAMLGHTVHVIRSFQEFLDLAGPPPGP
jgi:hypothetical protein